MKLLILTSILLFFNPTLFGQQVQMVHQGVESDSSFYYIKKINNNEFWAGGEYGVLKKIDSLGNMSALNFPNEGEDILKIESVGNYIYLITANAIIYRYDIEQQSFLTKKFPAFKNKCFYDLIILKSGKLLVCGGATGITEEKKAIPKGFIATIDQDLEKIDVVWKSARKFVWSLTELENQSVIAATFNGLNTQIIKSEDLKSWKNEIKIKGLVHEIANLDNQIWYCGAKSFHFKEAGIIGQASIGQKQKVLYDTGCLWSMDVIDGKVIAVALSGELLRVDTKRNLIEHLKLPNAFTLYDIERISESKIFVVGKWKGVYIVDI